MPVKKRQHLTMKDESDSKPPLVDLALLLSAASGSDIPSSLFLFSPRPSGLERIVFSMIVMKFGGTSVESGDAIARLVGTVNSHLAERPVVVVSALGKTTNKLLEFAEHARRGELYLGSKCLTELQDHHFEVASQVAHGEALYSLETSLQRFFRDLRVILSEVAQEGREVTPALLDEIASFGERMSSQIVAAALEIGRA